jgi:hypothetical protein
VSFKVRTKKEGNVEKSTFEFKIFYAHRQVRSGGDSAVVIAPDKAAAVLLLGGEFGECNMEEIGTANEGQLPGIVIHDQWHA